MLGPYIGVAPALLVALTGYGQEQDRRKAEAAGFDDAALWQESAGEVGPLLEQLATRLARDWLSDSAEPEGGR